MPARAEKWQLDPGETLVAEARVQPPGRIEAQSASSGFDLCLTDRRLLISKRRALRNGNRTSIVDSIPLEDIAAVRTEKRHPAATFGIPLYRLELCSKGREDALVCEAGGIWVAKLERIGRRLIEQRPELVTQPWPEQQAIEPASANAQGVELTEDQQRELIKAKRTLVALIAALVVVTTVGIVLWRSEDHPGGSFTISTMVLLAALWILLAVWQLWENIWRSTRRPETSDPSAANFKDASYASFGRRMIGFLIDAVGIAVFPIAAAAIYAATNVTTTPSGSGTQGAIVSVTLIAAYFLYPIVFIAMWNQTPGMKIMRIRLFQVSTTGALSSVGRSRAAARSLIAWGFVLALVWPSLIDYLWSLKGERHQCLHDKWTGTIALDIRNGRMPPSQRDAEDRALEDLQV